MGVSEILSKNLPTIMILLISITGAVGGYMSGQISNDIRDFNVDINEQDALLNDMTNEGIRIYDSDVDFLIRGIFYLDQAYLESYQYRIAKPTLTSTQIAERLDGMETLLLIAQDWFGRTNAVVLNDYFSTGGSQDQLQGGIDEFALTRADYLTLKENLVSEETTADFLVSYGMAEVTDIIDYISISSGMSSIIIPETDGLLEFMSIPIDQETDDLIVMKNDLVVAQTKQSGLIQAVSVITVATVLSAAMASRIYNKKNKVLFSQIRADVKQDESLLETYGDKIANLILPFALLISLVGLFLAFT